MTLPVNVSVRNTLEPTRTIRETVHGFITITMVSYQPKVTSRTVRKRVLGSFTMTTEL
jgi:ribosomal protein L34